MQEKGEVSEKEVEMERKRRYKEKKKRERERKQQHVENRNTLANLKSLKQLYDQLGKQR